jgi:2-phospho-L-lactate guanylyltransferase (CobY/MobA/RfbA family)
LIAIKARARCKTRLADSLTPSAWIDLVRWMLPAALAAADGAETLHDSDERPRQIMMRTISG